MQIPAVYKTWIYDLSDSLQILSACFFFNKSHLDHNTVNINIVFI